MSEYYANASLITFRKSWLLDGKCQVLAELEDARPARLIDIEAWSEIAISSMRGSAVYFKRRELQRM